MPANPSYQVAVGLGYEETPGTPVAPTVWIPTNAPKPSDNLKYYADKAFRGLPVDTFGHYGQMASSEFDIDGPFYPDVPSILLAATMGHDTVTAAPTPTTATPAITAGSSTITFASALPTGFAEGMAVLIDSTSSTLFEGNIIASIDSGAKTWTLVSPTRFAHTSGCTISGNTLHKLTLNTSGNMGVPSFTVFNRYLTNPSSLQRDYAYGLVSEFDISWSAEAETTYSAKLSTQLSNTTSSQSPSYSSVPPFMGWQSGVLINGSAQTNLADAKINLKRQVDPIPQAANSQSYLQFLASTLDVSGSATFIPTDDTEYDWYRDGTVQPIVFGVFGPAPGAQGSPAASGMLFQATTPTFTKGNFDFSKNWVQVPLDFNCDYNTTDGGACTIWVTNAITTNLITGS